MADSLMDQPVLDSAKSSPTSPYKARPRARQNFDFRIHDTITVNVNIDDTISFTKKQDYKRDTSWALGFKSLIDNFSGVQKASLPDLEVESEGQSKSTGQKQEGSQVRLDVPCEIIEILPQGDLVIEGIRTVRAGTNQAEVRVGGRVNPKYINIASDTVMSERILQLEVKTDYAGPLADNEKRGLLSKLMDKLKVF
jgi:flagellar L-ring protein precursor FlgH